MRKIILIISFGICITFVSFNFFKAVYQKERAKKSFSSSPLGAEARTKELESESPKIFFEKWNQDYEKFHKGVSLALATEPNFEAALGFFLENIRDYPNAKDIDYAYAWATICLVNLQKYEESFDYYKVIRSRFAGMQSSGASGAGRCWDDKMAELRGKIKLASDPGAVKISSEIDLFEASLPTSTENLE
ncbi:hypothetical protein HYY75_00985 [bacterium]|nr:hypothetical protein [bacterium]